MLFFFFFFFFGGGGGHEVWTTAYDNTVNHICHIHVTRCNEWLHVLETVFTPTRLNFSKYNTKRIVDRLQICTGKYDLKKKTKKTVGPTARHQCCSTIRIEQRIDGAEGYDNSNK